MTKITSLFVLLTVGWLFSFDLMAQEDKKVTFGGAGRFLMDNSTLDGDVLNGDTTTATRSLAGYALFDFGIDIRPGKNTEINAITRFRNELDGFWGAGIVADIRQLYARGLVKERIRYKIGDLNTAFTPYTMYNFQPELRVNEGSIFHQFEEITNYENFYQDSTWRQQGAEIDFALAFPSGIQEVTFRGLISKNRQTDFFFTPDRLFGAVQVGINQGTYGRLDLTYTNLFEVASSAQFSEAMGDNEVFSARYNLVGLDNDEYHLGLVGEAGMSMVSYKDQPENPEEVEDSFLEVGIDGHLKSFGLKGTISFVDVGPDFRSGAAQSRRLNVNATPTLFSRVGNEERQRNLNMVDIITDPTVYTRTFDPLLGAYLPHLENVQPFGAATPNRRGLIAKIRYEGDSAGIFGAFVNAAVLSEIRGQGTEQLRDFTKVWGGVTANINKIYAGERKILLTAGASYQNTSRDGTEGVDAVDLTSTFIEAGLDIQLSGSLDLLGGMKMLSAEGNEFLNDRDGFNTTVFYSKYDVDLTETYYAGGLRYAFSETIYLTAQGHFNTVEDNLTQSNSLGLNSVVVIYNMFF